MKFLLKLILLTQIGAGVTACSFALNKKISSQKISVLNNVSTQQNSIDSLVSPFKQELQIEMNQKIAFAEVDFINERYNGNLGCLVSDAFLEKGRQIEEIKKSGLDVVCVINWGGLRASINKGDVLLNDVYKLLPFDNYLVAVKLQKKAFLDIQKWIIKSGGHPISGFRIEKDNIIDAQGNEVLVENNTEEIWVITNDYLMNGGDNATFFTKNSGMVQTNFLLRDVFLEKIKNTSLKDIQEKRIIL
jgi:2',3'-cyclic-nucleotide 2'-phosphodiesterase (5'-nucleotidase family)